MHFWPVLAKAYKRCVHRAYDVYAPNLWCMHVLDRNPKITQFSFWWHSRQPTWSTCYLNVHQTLDSRFPYKYPHFHHLNGQKLLPYRNSIKIPQNIQTKSIKLEDPERVRTRLIFNCPWLENNIPLTSFQTSNWFKLASTLFKVVLVNPKQIVRLILLYTQLR